jgi:hypothetical protein
MIEQQAKWSWTDYILQMNDNIVARSGYLLLR